MTGRPSYLRRDAEARARHWLCACLVAQRWWDQAYRQRHRRSGLLDGAGDDTLSLRARRRDSGMLRWTTTVRLGWLGSWLIGPRTVAVATWAGWRRAPGLCPVNPALAGRE